MKRCFLLITLFLISSLLSACGAPQDAWTTYHAASDTLVNPNFPSYSFEHPSYWKMEEKVNHIAFVSEAKLFKDVPDKLEPGQIIVGLSLNKDMRPAEMVEVVTESLKSIIDFEEPVPVRLNGREAVYQKGAEQDMTGLLFVLAIDMGENTRGLLSARMAVDEFEKWEEVLFKMAESLQLDQ